MRYEHIRMYLDLIADAPKSSNSRKRTGRPSSRRFENTMRKKTAFCIPGSTATDRAGDWGRSSEDKTGGRILRVEKLPSSTPSIETEIQKILEHRL
jgi:hypothetical protein